MKRQTALERALPIIAAAYGEQFGVRVVLSGSDAYTNGETIVLPMLESMSELQDVLFGYLAHESAHVRDSDFGVMKRCQSPVERSMTNLIEDIRIERLIQEAFPGTQFTLTAMEEYIHAQGWTAVPTHDENEATQLQRYLYLRLYGEFLSREVYQPLIPASRQVIEQTFPAGFFVRLDGLLGKYIDTLSCSNDSLKVARAILKALKDAEKEEAQNQQNSPNAGSESCNSPQGSDADQTNPGNQASDAGNESQPDTGSDDSPGSADPGDPADDQDGSDSVSDQDGNDDPGDQSQACGASAHDRMIQETDLPEDNVERLRGALSEQAQTAQGGSRFLLDASVGDDVVTGEKGTDGLTSGILASSTIRSRLIGLLQSQTRRKQWLHNRGSRVDGRRLCRLASGDPRVFIQREETKRPDTAVHVLLDTSGSMTHQQDIANAATVSLALAISSIPQCDIAVSMFPGRDGQVSPMIRRGQPIRPNLGRFSVSSSGGTPLAEALLYSARELAASHKPRKVQIVITDGAPNNGDAVQYINRLTAGHIDTYAIGIASDAVRQHFSHWCTINDVKELQSALFTIASNALGLDI